MAESGKQCSQCKNTFTKDKFSATQWSKSPQVRKCLACTGGPQSPPPKNSVAEKSSSPVQTPTSPAPAEKKVQETKPEPKPEEKKPQEHKKPEQKPQEQKKPEQKPAQPISVTFNTSSNLLNTGDVVKLISKKEESTGSTLTHSHSRTIQAQAKPGKVDDVCFTVHKYEDGTFGFENKAAAGFLSSTTPSFAVSISEGKPADLDTIKWKLFNKAKGELSPVISLDAVWFQSVKTGGFLSVRSNEAWSGKEGRAWTRNQNNEPALPQSWEVLEIKVVTPSLASSSKGDLKTENGALKKELQELLAEVERLRAEVKKGELYKASFAEFKRLVQNS